MKSKQHLIADTLHASSPTAKVILDVGYAQHPNPHLKGDVHGIDIMELPLPPGYKSVRKCDLNIERIPFDGRTFDAVTMGCTLAHVTSPVQLILEIHRVLKKDGILVLSSPNPQYYWEWALNAWFHFFKKRVVKAKFEEHFYSFSRYNMRTIAHRTGFTVIDEVGCSFQLVKTKIKFNPIRFPGFAYEIIYVLQKTGEPQGYTTYEGPEGIVKVPTILSDRYVVSS